MRQLLLLLAFTATLSASAQWHQRSQMSDMPAREEAFGLAVNYLNVTMKNSKKAFSDVSLNELTYGATIDHIDNWPAGIQSSIFAMLTFPKGGNYFAGGLQLGKQIRFGDRTSYTAPGISISYHYSSIRNKTYYQGMGIGVQVPVVFSLSDNWSFGITPIVQYTMLQIKGFTAGCTLQFRYNLFRQEYQVPARRVR